MILIIVLEILVIWYMIWDNVRWQEKVLRNAGVTVKKKLKLKKGQKIIFGKENPFEENHADTSAK